MIRLSAFLLAIALPLAAQAAGHTGSLADGTDGDMQYMSGAMEKLNLTENQKNDFAALLGLYRPRFEEIIKRGKEDREALLDMAPDDPGYNALVYNVGAEAGRSATETVTLLAELQGLIYALLDEEQQAAYMTMRAERKAKMQEMRERYREGGYEGYHTLHHGEDAYCPHHADHHGGEQSTDSGEATAE
jgi:Spy/CpxP family protein refolding chaperone